MEMHGVSRTIYMVIEDNMPKEGIYTNLVEV
jgi:hypothetical protein